MRRALAWLAGLAALASQAAAAEGPLQVAAANPPLAYFAERIAGDAAVIAMPVPAGANPETWQPGIAELTALQEADLILLNGAGQNGWTERVSLPRSRAVDTGRTFADDLIEVEGVTHSHGSEGAHTHGAIAVNTWLDFRQAALQAEAVAAALSRARPEQAGGFERRLAELTAELEALDARAARAAAKLAGKQLLASHAGYEYFARRYGLALATVSWDPADPPDAAALAALDVARAGRNSRLMLWNHAPGPGALDALTARGITPVVLATGATAAPSAVMAGFHAGVAALEQAVEASRSAHVRAP